MIETGSPSRDDVASARERIAPYVRRTPVLDVSSGTFGIEAPITLKLELLQVTGSFKPRGAFNRMITADVGLAGVVAASGGNFGLAVGHAARELGHHAEIFMPSTSPAAKIDKVRATGAEVRVIDGYYDDAAEAAAARRDETGAVWMHPYDQAPVVAGPAQAPQATVVPLERMMNFLEANYVAPQSGRIGVDAAKASVVRVICVRK